MRNAPDAVMDAAALAAIFGPWADRRGILLAVSGGPDSMALMLLAAQWAKTSPHPPIFAATVDHGLREEARAEAKLVAASAKNLGIPHKTLNWKGEKPATAIQEKAREARYGLLLSHAHKIGADVVMTAHHADDQAETILFRLLRGSGLTGLSGMKAETAREDIVIARPLLGLRKADLVAICHESSQQFVDDPSNVDAHFGRTEMRALLLALEKHGLRAGDLTRLGKRLARADSALAQAAVELHDRAASPPAAGKLDMGALAAAPEEIALRALGLFLETSGAQLPLKLERLEALSEKLRAAVGRGEAEAATLAGLKLKLDRKGALTALKEGPRRRGRSGKERMNSASPENRLSLLK